LIVDIEVLVRQFKLIVGYNVVELANNVFGKGSSTPPGLT